MSQVHNDDTIIQWGDFYFRFPYWLNRAKKYYVCVHHKDGFTCDVEVPSENLWEGVSCAYLLPFAYRGIFAEASEKHLVK